MKKEDAEQIIAANKNAIFDRIRTHTLESAVAEQPTDETISSYMNKLTIVGSENEEKVTSKDLFDVTEIDLDLSAEYIQAYSAEVIYLMDKDFVDKLKENASYVSAVDLDAEKENAKYLGDALEAVGDKLYDLADMFDGGYTFIVASPLTISIMQAGGSSVFVPAIEGTFKGPNNTMLVGQADGTDVYSYIFEMDYVAGNTDTVLVANFNPETNEIKSAKLTVYNFNFC